MGFLGGGGGNDSFSSEPTATRNPNPQPVPPYISAGGGFLGRSRGNQISEADFDPEYYLKQNPDVAADPYYGKNPFEHYQDFGFAERRNPFDAYQYAPSQQQRYNEAYEGLSARPDLVMDAYQRIAGRAPDQEGFDFWTDQMRQGMTGQGLVSGFTASPEFQRQQEYNRAYTEAFRPGYQEFGPNQQYYQPIYQSRYSEPTGMYRPSYNPFSYDGGAMGGDRPNLDAIRSLPMYAMSGAPRFTEGSDTGDQGIAEAATK